MTIAPSSMTTMPFVELSPLDAPLLASFALLGELSSSTSEIDLLLPLDFDEVPLVAVAALSCVPLESWEAFFLRAMGDAGSSLSGPCGSAGAGRSTPFIGLSSRASLLGIS